MISIREHQDQFKFPPSTVLSDTSSVSSAINLNSLQDQGAMHGGHYAPEQEQQMIGLLSVGGPSDQSAVHDQASEICNQSTDYDHASGSVKWMSSKMRLMRKMLGSSDRTLGIKQRRMQPIQGQNEASSSSSSCNSPTDIIRVCSNCKTTKTPLWRSGPQGPKSLCNACGIRQMKARRAMRAAAAAAAAGLGSGIMAAANSKLQQGQEKISDVDRTVPFKKRFKILTSASAEKKLHFDEITVSLSKKLAYHQTFPQEEKDAAILLMALSCGLIHG